MVPSASKMMRELFGKVPCEEELAVILSEPLGGEAQGINILSYSLGRRSQITARCF